MTTKEIATKLHALVTEGDYNTAYNELFSENAVAIEPKFPGFERVEGLENIREKTQALVNQVSEIKSRSVTTDLIVGDNHFSFGISIDAIMLDGNSFRFAEVALYEVADGKIISKQFFY